MSASEDSIFTRPFASMLFPVHRAHAPYCYRCPLGLERATCAIDCLGDLERLLAEHGPTVAGVLVEPMLQGAGGMIVWPAEFLGGVRRLCDRFGVLMIADEVLTGFGRTGRMFACEHAAVSPDIICLSKALTGGYLPLGATVTSDSCITLLSDDRTNTFFHGHSFGQSACVRRGDASLELFHDSGTLTREATSRLAAHLSRPAGVVAVSRNVRVSAVSASSNWSPTRRPERCRISDPRRPTTRGGISSGLLLHPLGNILFMPPWVTQRDRLGIEQVKDVLSGSGL